MGSLLRTTLEQVGAVKEAVEQQARGRGGLIDQAMVQRRRKDAMAKLGEAVHRLAQSGELGELALDPKVGMLLEEIDAIDGDDGEDWQPDDDLQRTTRGNEAVSSASYAPRAAQPSAAEGEYRVWRPTRPGQPEREEIADQPADNESPAPPPGPGRSSRLPRKSAQRAGAGIRFVEEKARPEDPDSDEDLESYMHDDDVPNKD